MWTSVTDNVDANFNLLLPMHDKAHYYCTVTTGKHMHKGTGMHLVIGKKGFGWFLGNENYFTVNHIFKYVKFIIWNNANFLNYSYCK